MELKDIWSTQLSYWKWNTSGLKNSEGNWSNLGIWLKVQIVYLEGLSKTAWVPFSLLSNEALFFQFTKCGKPDCQLCKPPRLPGLTFDKLLHTPDTTLGTDGHYLSFCKFLERVLMKSTVSHYKNLLGENLYNLLLVFSMPLTLATLCNVKNVRCDIWYIQHINCHL